MVAAPHPRKRAHRCVLDAATPAYGRALAAALSRGRFALIEQAGHLPQLEQPEATFAAIDAFIAET